jgi:transposase-like protein
MMREGWMQMIDKSKRQLTPNQRMAAELLGSGMKRKEAAQEVGVHEETITKWKRSVEFREAVREAADTFITDMRLKALDVFSKHLEDDDKRIAQQAAGYVVKLSESLAEKEYEKQVHISFLYMPKPGEVQEDSSP